jgi:hypothetical protein
MSGFGILRGASKRTWTLFLATLLVLAYANTTEGGIGGSARRGVQSLNGLTGAVTLSAGANITLTPTGNDIEIAATGGTGDVETVGDCTGPDCFTPGSPDAALTFDNATSGTVTLQTVAGALGAVTASLPAETGTILTSATNAVGDVTGTFGATVVGDDSHDHAGTTLTIDTNITGTLAVDNGGTETTSLTDGGIMLGSGTAAVTVTAQPTNGQVLIGSTGVDPVLATLTDGTGVTVTEGAGSITIASTLGTSVDLTTEVTGTLPVGNGGTGVTAPTDGGLLLGSGAGALTSLAQATNGQLPIGSTGGDPTLATITGTANEIDVTNGAGSITLDIADLLDLNAKNLELPQASPAAPATDGAVELDMTDGKLVIQNSTSHAAFGTATDVVYGSAIKGPACVTLAEPDVMQGLIDNWPMLAVESTKFPHGIEITRVYLKTDASSTLSVVLEKWSSPTDGAPDTLTTIATSASTEADEAPDTEGTVGTSEIIMLDLDTTDVNWLELCFDFYEPIS